MSTSSLVAATPLRAPSARAPRAAPAARAPGRLNAVPSDRQWAGKPAAHVLHWYLAPQVLPEALPSEQAFSSLVAAQHGNCREHFAAAVPAQNAQPRIRPLAQ